MKLYFDSLSKLESFTLNIDCYVDKVECPICSKRGQLVSHGYLYRWIGGILRVVGKRILCAARRGRNGCGSTQSLYIKTDLPRFHYTVVHVCHFFMCLVFLKKSVAESYQLATNCYDSRNAYRWVSKAKNKFSQYRHFLERQSLESTDFTNVASSQLRVLMATIRGLFDKTPCFSPENYHTITQTPFI